MKILTAELHRALKRQPGKFDPLPYEPLQGRLETVDCAASHYVPEQLERVVACHGAATTVESEIAKLESRSWTEVSPHVAHLRDAVVFGGWILTVQSRHHMSSFKSYRSILDTLASYEDVAVPNTVPGLRYFGHWLRDDCAAHEMLRGTSHRIMSLKRPAWPDCAIYESRFDQNWSERNGFHARSLYLFSDIAFSLGKKSRLEAMRARMQTEPREGGIVYLRRGRAGQARHIANERELMDGLAGRGVRIVEPERGGEDIVQECLGADLIITVEGSQAAHAIYLLKDGGGLLILQPPDRFYNPHVEWTRIMGMRYGIVVGEVAEGGMQVHLDEVLSMADRLLN